MKVLVAGSSNIDLVARVNSFPVPGETIGGARFMQNLGGKGANQAVAAARMGGDVTFVTSLGNDVYAGSIRETIAREGINTGNIVEDPSNPTGTAIILVAASGENCIVVAPGANYSLTSDSIPGLDALIDDADIIVMQAEIPYETNRFIAQRASSKGKKVLFNPAPACHIDRGFMQAISILVVNETEASFISGIDYDGDNIDVIADALIESGAPEVVITLGSRGVYMKNTDTTIRIPARKVNVVDTTAAGDTFCGALAVMCAGRSIDRDALEFANTAASLAVTRAGAIPSIPYLDEVIPNLQQNINQLNRLS